jgi:hypothetical protein
LLAALVAMAALVTALPAQAELSNSDVSWPDDSTVYFGFAVFDPETTSNKNFPPWMTSVVCSAAYAWDSVGPSNGPYLNYLAPSDNKWRLAPMDPSTQATTGVYRSGPWTISSAQTYVNSYYNWMNISAGSGAYWGLLATEFFDSRMLDFPTIAKHEWGHWIHLVDIGYRSGDIMQGGSAFSEVRQITNDDITSFILTYTR